MPFLSRTIYPSISNPSAPFTITIPYNEEAHVQVRFYADDAVNLPDALTVGVDYSFTSNGVISFLSGHKPTVGDTVDIRRSTPYDLPDLTAPSVLRTSALNLRLRTLRYIAEETQDAISAASESFAESLLRSQLESIGGASRIGTEEGYTVQDQLDGSAPITALKLISLWLTAGGVNNATILFGDSQAVSLTVGPVGGVDQLTLICSKFGISDGGTRSPFFWDRATGIVTVDETLNTQKNTNLGNGSGDITTITGKLIHATSSTPASAAAAGTLGQTAWDASYEYRCTATNTWVRSAHATW